jgi:hypothetical protein
MVCPQENWPGVALVDVAPDWQGFKALQVDVWLHGNTPITLGIALRGIGNRSDHHDSSRHFALKPGFNSVSWPLDDIAHKAIAGPILLSRIGKIIVFCMPENTRKTGTQLSFDNLKLVN